ncbi:TonB-dependent hemoglobin/transferrin/lactoferrin family receptor [Methylomonas sp. MED-D]|uniref:TonB-dependent hemoglobin/transferrin/lactoferrin family receptor n=1 Tax=Methylomonas sp. MED-D TaxID=3418768 RepID=UPI003CFDA627
MVDIHEFSTIPAIRRRYPKPLPKRDARHCRLCLMLWLLAGPTHAEEPSTDAAEDLELPTVTVKSAAEVQKTASAGTQSTIEAATIEQRMVRDIKDLIRYEPGVNVGSDPQRFGSTGFTIRGLGGNRVLMQIDGVRLPDSFGIGSFANSTRNAVDMDALKAVEIVRGSGPAAYGGDALGGTVNFVTKDPQDYLKVFGKPSYTGLKLHYNTTDNQFSQTGTAAGALGGWEGLAVFTHSHGNETDNQGGIDSRDARRTLPSPQDNQGYNLLAKLLYRFNDDNVLRISGEWLNKVSEFDALYGQNLDISNRFVNRMLTDDDQSRWRLALDHTLKAVQTPLFDQVFWQFYTQRSATRQVTFQDRTSNANGHVLVERIFDFDNQDLGGQLRLDKHFQFAVGEHDLQYGGQISKNSVAQQRDGTLTCLTGKPRPPRQGGVTPECGNGKGTVTHTILPDEFPVRDFPLSTVTKAGAYLQDTIGLFDRRVELIPGGRWEYYRLLPKSDYLFEKASAQAVAEGAAPIVPTIKDAEAFLPKFGALLHLNATFTLHGQYSHGFRGPNFSDSNLGFTNATFGYTTIPNSALTPETSVGAEVGLRGQGGAGQFDATLFRNDYEDFMYDATICDQGSGCQYLTFQTVNSPDPIRMQGVEFKSQVFLDWFWPELSGASLLLSGSYTEGTNLRSGRSDDVALRKISPIKGVVGLRYDRAAGDWGGELILTLVGPKQAATAPADASYLTSGYGVVDFNAYYRINPHVSLNLGVFNVFDSRYIDWEDVDTQESNPHRNLGPFANADIRDRYSRPGRNLGVTLKIAY